MDVNTAQEQFLTVVNVVKERTFTKKIQSGFVVAIEICRPNLIFHIIALKLLHAC